MKIETGHKDHQDERRKFGKFFKAYGFLQRNLSDVNFFKHRKRQKAVSRWNFKIRNDSNILEACYWENSQNPKI